VKNVVHHRIGGVQSALEKKTQKKITENKKNKFYFVSSGGVTRERERQQQQAQEEEEEGASGGGWRCPCVLWLQSPGSGTIGTRAHHRLFIFFYFIFSPTGEERETCVRASFA
jgi:hypothetical protein